MPNKISPHDRYMRSMMSHPKVIEEFFQANLPSKIKDAIDFQSIELQKESFIDDKLRLKIADLLYAAKFEGKPGYLYLLFEHASKSDRLLPFRMLKYMVAIMDHQLTKTATKELPVIYPLILYTGSRPFSHSMDLFDLFGAQKPLVKEILKNPYHLIDLSQASDEDLKKYLWFGTVALTAKHIHDADIFPFLREILKALKIIEESGENSYIYSVISYVVEVAEVSDKQKFMETLTTGLKSINEDKIMNIASQLEPEIYERGRRSALQEAEAAIEQSKQEALRAKQEALRANQEALRAKEEFLRANQEALQAKQEALVNVALNLLKLQKSVEEVSEATGISLEDIEALKKQIH